MLTAGFGIHLVLALNFGVGGGGHGVTEVGCVILAVSGSAWW